MSVDYLETRRAAPRRIASNRMARQLRTYRAAMGNDHGDLGGLDASVIELPVLARAIERGRHATAETERNQQQRELRWKEKGPLHRAITPTAVATAAPTSASKYAAIRDALRSEVCPTHGTPYQRAPIISRHGRGSARCYCAECGHEWLLTEILPC